MNGELVADPKELGIKPQPTEKDSSPPKPDEKKEDNLAQRLLHKIHFGSNKKPTETSGTTEEEFQNVDNTSLHEAVEANKALIFTPEEEARIDETLDNSEEVKQIEKSFNLIRWFADHIKENPEVLMAISGSVIGALAIIGNTPIPVPPEMLSKIAAALGGASVGIGKGESLGKKIAFGLVGATSAAGAVEGAGHVVSADIAGAVIGVADDVLAPAAALSSPIIRKGAEIGRKLIEK